MITEGPDRHRPARRKTTDRSGKSTAGHGQAEKRIEGYLWTVPEELERYKSIVSHSPALAFVQRVGPGANVQNNGSDSFAIGKRNYLTLKKIFWKNGILIDAEDVGGSHARTMYLDVGSGRVWLSISGVEKEL